MRQEVKEKESGKRQRDESNNKKKTENKRIENKRGVKWNDDRVYM